MQRYRVSFYYRNYRIGARHVRARSEGEAEARIRHLVPGSSQHIATRVDY